MGRTCEQKQSTGSMDCLKSAVVTPLLKNMDEILNNDDLKNVLPISNVQYLSNLIERCVAVRFHLHHKSHQSFQKAFLGVLVRFLSFS